MTALDRSTQDRVEIAELISRFNRAADMGLPDELADTFVDDGAFEGIRGVARGRDQLKAFVMAVHRPQDEAGAAQHLTHNVVVDFVDDDNARLSADLLMVAAHPAGPRFTFVGRYADLLVRTSAGWRFTHRLVTRIGPEPGP